MTNTAYNLGYEASSMGISHGANPYQYDFNHDDWVMWGIGWFAHKNVVAFND